MNTSTMMIQVKLNNGYRPKLMAAKATANPKIVRSA